MKKLFLFFMSLAVLTACSNDDDTTEEEPILGTWFIVEVNNPPGSNFSLSECNKNSTMTFNADGTATSVFHSEIQGNCTPGPPSESTWNNLNDFYTITIPIPELEGFNTLTGTIEFTSNTFIFTPTVSQSTTIVFERG